jgi:multisubunit Na+/H+ antiporter MnhC subunit
MGFHSSELTRRNIVYKLIQKSGNAVGQAIVVTVVVVGVATIAKAILNAASNG